MRSHNIWWFDACDSGAVSDFRRRSLLSLDIDPRTGPASAEVVARFEQDMAVGDIVVVGDDVSGALMIGEVEGVATRRPGIGRMQALRGIRWYETLPHDACDQSLISAVHELPKMSVLDGTLLGTIDAMLPSVAANEDEDAKPLDFDISCEPPKVTLPSLPILFQSPYAEQILRDFRWREYRKRPPTSP